MVTPLLRLYDVPEAGGFDGFRNQNKNTKQIINDYKLCLKEKRFTCALRT